MKQRIAARLLLASCVLAVGLGLGMAMAVTGVTGLLHEPLEVRSPGQAEGKLYEGVYELFLARADSGGQAACTVTGPPGGEEAPTVASDGGFTAVRIARTGPHRVSCTSAVPVEVRAEHKGEPVISYLGVIGKGLLVSLLFTVLSAVLAARALLTVRRMRSAQQAAGGTAPAS